MSASHNEDAASSRSVASFLEKDQIVSDDMVKRLKTIAKKSELGRSRICLHSSSESKLHTMLICLSGYAKIPLHYSTNESELFYIYHSGKLMIRIPDIGNTILLDGMNGLAYSTCYSRRREIVNLSHEESLYWEICLGPHKPSDTKWIIE